jgi:hypothetical protein
MDVELLVFARRHRHHRGRRGGLAELTAGTALGVGLLGAVAAMGLGRADAHAPSGPRPAGA